MVLYSASVKPWEKSNQFSVNSCHETGYTRAGQVQHGVVINRILEERGLTQVQAAPVLGVSQPKVSALKGYKLEGFSVARLMHFANAHGWGAGARRGDRDSSASEVGQQGSDFDCWGGLAVVFGGE